jgi:hypothetical protein
MSREQAETMVRAYYKGRGDAYSEWNPYAIAAVDAVTAALAHSELSQRQAAPIIRQALHASVSAAAQEHPVFGKRPN